MISSSHRYFIYFICKGMCCMYKYSHTHTYRHTYIYIYIMYNYTFTYIHTYIYILYIIDIYIHIIIYIYIFYIPHTNHRKCGRVCFMRVYCKCLLGPIPRGMVGMGESRIRMALASAGICP